MSSWKRTFIIAGPHGAGSVMHFSGSLGRGFCWTWNVNSRTSVRLFWLFWVEVREASEHHLKSETRSYLSLDANLSGVAGWLGHGLGGLSMHKLLPIP
jgi:hypothetical protein